jgi:hypothetical protein
VNNKPTKESSEATRVSVSKEMAKPRISKSAREATINLAASKHRHRDTYFESSQNR